MADFTAITSVPEVSRQIQILRKVTRHEVATTVHDRKNKMLGKSKTKEKVMISSFRRRDSVSVPIELS
jgi:hypothetical protein